MLLGSSTKYGAGFRLAGDHTDLCDLYETIHYFIPENSLIPPHHDEFVLGLAYDVRHAYQGDRDTQLINNPNGSSIYFAVDILWPICLVQVAMLRAIAAYLPTTRSHQATLYRIEACIESALNAIDATVSHKCCDWLHDFSPLPEGYLMSFVSQQSKLYVLSATTAKSRLRKLPEIISDISPYSPAYKEYETELRTIAEQQKCSPDDLHDDSEWPKFKW